MSDQSPFSDFRREELEVALAPGQLELLEAFALSQAAVEATARMSRLHARRD